MTQRKPTSVSLENEQLLGLTCPFVYALGLMGKRWKPAILWKLLAAPQRFGELKRAIPLASEKMLTDHLRELERDGLITRRTIATKPLHIEYQLTALGESLAPLLTQLNVWGLKTYVQNQ